MIPSRHGGQFDKIPLWKSGKLQRIAKLVAQNISSPPNGLNLTFPKELNSHPDEKRKIFQELKDHYQKVGAECRIARNTLEF